MTRIEVAERLISDVAEWLLNHGGGEEWCECNAPGVVVCVYCRVREFDASTGRGKNGCKGHKMIDGTRHFIMGCKRCTEG